MVKKFIIALVLSLTMGVFLIPSKVNAENWGTYRGLDWEFYNYFSDIYGMRVTIELPENVGRFKITIPNYAQYIMFEDGGIDSNICFDAPSGCVNFIDLFYTTPPKNLYGEFDIWLNAINGVDYSNSTTISFNLVVSFDIMPSGFYQEWQDNVTIELPNALTVRFYVAGYMYDIQYIVNQLPTNPTPPADIGDAEFIYWRTINGDVFSFASSQILDEYLDGDVLNLYAVFAGLNDNIYIPPDEPNNTNTPDAIIDLLDAVGMANTGGYVFIYVILILIASFLIIKIGGGAFVAIMIDIIIFGTFIYMGLLPLYMIILSVLIFIFAFLYSLNSGGGVTNE